jgi:hypothetical protein
MATIKEIPRMTNVLLSIFLQQQRHQVNAVPSQKLEIQLAPGSLCAGDRLTEEASTYRFQTDRQMSALPVTPFNPVRPYLSRSHYD